MWWLFTTCLEWFCDSLGGLNPVKVMVLKMKMVLGYLLSPGYEGPFCTLNKCSSWVLLISVFPLWLRMVKQYNKVEALRSPDEGAVEVDLISSVVSSRFCALV
ncbi:hypothetical protein F2Q70_00034385 [Brassica cretica]|uniref:Uncharacterized protein n=1 Tax=Brassica cretica TaxID=69181 RepID=A0A8S9JX97_BRACR|nr:hypothetical protein F2Q70_00034385 [Brassica cretica]